MSTSPRSHREHLVQLGDDVHSHYERNRRVMSFAEYLDLVAQSPETHLRSAPQYVLDCFEHYGSDTVTYPWGEWRRFHLFDCPWADGRDRLVGHEAVQNHVYRALTNFVNEGTANKLILLHGPNGSAKSTFIRCVGRAMQDYSTKDKGALYRINWIFPGQRISRSGIGFSGEERSSNNQETYAYLPDELVDAKLSDELRDHPMFLIPVKQRQALMASCFGQGGEAENEPSFVLSDYLRYGRLSHKNRAIYEALLASYHGDYLKVLRHVQIERFYIQHRYREGYVTVEPQLSVDANERQITADRSVTALPTALQSVSLYEYSGELVNGNRGLIEFSDLLKRPLEAYKYLLTTVEQASVSLPSATLFFDLIFLGTSNEIHLSAFKEIPEFQSFKGRLDLVRVPYLLDVNQEEEIYAHRVREAAGSRHIAPHCAYVAGLWAVLTRMRKPQSDAYPPRVAELVARLTPLEKAELYAYHRVPDYLDEVQAKELRGALNEIWHESDTYPYYEGRSGVSPREMLSVLFNAANSTSYTYVSPLAIIDEIESLTKQLSVYSFLKQDVQPGGFHDHRRFVDLVRERLVDRIDDDVHSAMGLVEETEYERIFQRYITHVTHWTRDEKVVNPTTGRAEDPDANFMDRIERTMSIIVPKEDFRRDLISKIGAWSIDNPNETPNYTKIFADYFRRLKADYYAQRKKQVRRGVEDVLMLLTADGAGLGDEDRRQAQRTVDALIERYGYRNDSARDALGLLVRRRYSGS